MAATIETQPGLKPVSEAPLPAPLLKKPRIISCISCQQRKVKCDRQDPCGPCTKSRLQCLYRPPAPPRRRKKKAPGAANLHERLARLEEMLKSAGGETDVATIGAALASLSSPSEQKPFLNPATSGPTPPASDRSTATGSAFDAWTPGKDAEKKSEEPVSEFGTGKMFNLRGKTLYTENKLWALISDEVRDLREMIEESSEEEEDLTEWSAAEQQSILKAPEDFMFTQRPTRQELHTLHPPGPMIVQLWRLYLEGVDPLTKIVHIPTLEPTVTQAISQPDQLSKSDHALLFAIYACGVMTLEDDECVAQLGEPKSTLQERYHHAGRQALIRAGLFRTTDLRVLQAFVLFLMSIRLLLDARSFWTLTGTASRIAQRMGVHRDGADYGFPPFETEMRRRLWWTMRHLDFSAGELCGSDLTPTITIGDALPPLSINDADISPSSVSLPPERPGATEMMYPCIYNVVAKHFRENIAHLAKQPGSTWEMKAGDPRLQAIVEKMHPLRERVRDEVKTRFLDFADPSVPVQRFVIMRLRHSFLTFDLRNRPHLMGSRRGLSRDDRDLLFTITRQVVATEAELHADPMLRQFRWHLRSHVQWHNFLSLLTELRVRAVEYAEGHAGKPAEEAWRELEAAWKAVDAALQNHPQLIERKDPLHQVILNMAFRAWETLEREFPGGRGPTGDVLIMPAVLTALRQRRQSKSDQGSSGLGSSDYSAWRSDSQGLDGTPQSGDLGLPEGVDFSLFGDSMAMMGEGADGTWDPNAWDGLVQGYHMHGAAAQANGGMPGFNGVAGAPGQLPLIPRDITSDAFGASTRGS